MLQLLRSAGIYAPGLSGRLDIFVAGGVIARIGRGLPTLPRELPLDETGLGGLRVIHGLIDRHVHLTGGGGEQGFGSRVPPIALSRLTGAGITTLVALRGTDCHLYPENPPMQEADCSPAC